MFCEVDRSYIEDGFNLYGLRHWVPNINESLDVILDRVGLYPKSYRLLSGLCIAFIYTSVHIRVFFVGVVGVGNVWKTVKAA